MNINASIIDQRLSSVKERIKESAANELNIRDEERLKSLAFTHLCICTVLDLDDETAFECLTEGGGDFGIDALHLSEEHDGEFVITLVQSKYKRDLNVEANFPEDGITKLVSAIRLIFAPSAELKYINARLAAKVETARSLISDGYIPLVRTLACNNGRSWNQAAQEYIDLQKFGDQVTWDHVNHDLLIKISQSTKAVSETLKFSGKAVIEDMNFSRVFVGRIAVTEIAALIERHGERLLERNIRRYLGLQGNRVNEAISKTLQTEEKENFYFYNNGITLTCDQFSHNALQQGDYQVRIENLQIINGGQTCMTIFRTVQQVQKTSIFQELMF